MLRTIRFSIARLMGAVLVAAIGFAALRNPSEGWAGGMLLLTWGVLLLAAVGAICRGPEERPWWLGFALFGGGYLALAYWTASSQNPLPTITLAESIHSWLGEPFQLRNRRDWLSPAHRILHDLWALASAGLGSLLAGLFIADPPTAEAGTVEQRAGDAPRSGRRWKRAVLIGLSGFWILAMAAAVGRWPAPGLWAGSTFLLTCGLLGLAGLAAAFRRGRDQGPWLGAALFGLGYLALTFGRTQYDPPMPRLPTEALINLLVRPGGPPIDSSFPDFWTPDYFRLRGRSIRRKLEQPIAMPFPSETPLEDVLGYLKRATSDQDGTNIPIYVDPIGLENSGRTLKSTVSLERDTIPVKTALWLCLKQLGLRYCVRSNYIMISDDDSAMVPVFEDPVQVVGNSLLALVAAAVGAAGARFICGRKGVRP